MSPKAIPGRLLTAVFSAFPPAFKTIRFLLSVMIPVSLAVVLLEQSGIMYRLSIWLTPLMKFLGLPGEASLVFLSSMLLNLYSAIAVINQLHLDPRHIIILSTMCLIAHNLIVESAVMKKTGSAVSKMLSLRIFNALIAGFFLNLILPQGSEAEALSTVSPVAPTLGFDLSLLPTALKIWAFDTLKLFIKISLIITALMTAQKILEAFGLMKLLGKIMSPFMRLMGLPSSTGFLWIISNIVGLAYGAAILIEQVDSGNISPQDSDLFNHHAAISHSLLEDSLLFMALGVPFALAVLPRFTLALLVVWMEIIRRLLFRRSFRVEIL